MQKIYPQNILYTIWAWNLFLYMVIGLSIAKKIMFSTQFLSEVPGAIYISKFQINYIEFYLVKNIISIKYQSYCSHALIYSVVICTE